MLASERLSVRSFFVSTLTVESAGLASSSALTMSQISAPVVGSASENDESLAVAAVSDASVSDGRAGAAGGCLRVMAENGEGFACGVEGEGYQLFARGGVGGSVGTGSGWREKPAMSSVKSWRILASVLSWYSCISSRWSFNSSASSSFTCRQ